MTRSNVISDLSASAAVEQLSVHWKGKDKTKKRASVWHILKAGITTKHGAHKSNNYNLSQYPTKMHHPKSKKKKKREKEKKNNSTT